MRPTEQSGDEAKRFRAPDGLMRGNWLRRTIIGVLEWLLVRATGRDTASGYAALIDTLPFGVACWGADARLLASNDRFAERLGVAPDALAAGAAYHEVVKGLAQGGYMQSVREDFENRLLELHREDGSTLLIEERPLAGSGFVTLLMDVTESRRTNQLLTTVREEQRLLARRYHEEKLRAEAASRSKTSFLAHLSHDIRTPLNHIIGFADMMRQQPYGALGDPRYLGYVEAVKTSGERLLGFFGSILELAELEGGRRELRSDRFTADELLVGVFRRFAGQAQHAGVIFGLGGPCTAMLTADRFALERMVSNLVENAVRFTPRGGKVTLAAYAGSDGVVLEITDTGIGMTAERLATLSQPFVFGDAALTRDREGAGLGIAIARAIAELSGGHLAIDSRQGLGTTVAVSLPVLAEEAAKAA
ncbi:MAG: histidine kinase [Devosia sp.]|jgi:two-component system, cell cycle sensor histidine kinase PleC|nr:histidine kinase [Devosia sp.]RYE48276.1 MAG: PAS domain-containing sensor histidine kinase [Hyphomicrobiales bacterium]